MLHIHQLWLHRYRQTADNTHFLTSGWSFLHNLQFHFQTDWRCSNSSRRNRKSSRSDVLHKSAPQVQTRDMLILHIHTTNRTQMSAGCLVCEAHLDHNRIKTEPRTLKLIVQPTRLTDRHRSQYFRDQTLIIIWDVDNLISQITQNWSDQRSNKTLHSKTSTCDVLKLNNFWKELWTETHWALFLRPITQNNVKLFV